MVLKIQSILLLIAKQRTWLSLLSILSALFLVMFGAFAVISALYQGTNMDTYAANGTFQLYNPLRRLAEGQIIGHDFPFFHGVGIPLLHYPVFTALGENVFAAETAKWLVSPLLFLFSSCIFFYAYFRDGKKALIATALFTALAIFCIDVVYPGNSLIGARSTIPVLIAAAIVWKSEKYLVISKYRIPYKDIALIILLGLAVICGTEHGVAAIVAFIIVRGLLIYKDAGVTLNSFLRLLALIAAIGVSVLIIITLSTLGHPLQALHYAFIDIPADQGWYFGTPPNTYLTWENLIPMLIESRLRFVYLTLAAAVIGIYIAVKTKMLTPARQQVFLFMILYGIIVFAAGVLGYYAPNGQLVPFHRVLGLITVALAVEMAFSHYLWRKQPLKKGASRPTMALRGAKLAFPYVVCILGVIFITSQITTYTKLVNSYPIKDTINKARVARHEDDYFASSPAWKSRLDSFKPYLNMSTSVWSTYTSVYDSYLSHSLNPSKGGEDYIIHALGKDRRESYEKDFIHSNSDYAITLKPTYFPYEEWLFSRHWRFYDHLLTNYELVAENGSHFLWKHKEGTAQSNVADIAIKGGNNSYALPNNNTNKIKLYQITIDYKAESGLMSALDKIPRYLINIDGASALRYPVSLPSTEKRWTFPVVLMPNEGNVSLKSEIGGIIPPASLTINSVGYREVPIESGNEMLFLNNYCSIEGLYLSNSRCSDNNLNLEEYKKQVRGTQ